MVLLLAHSSDGQVDGVALGPLLARNEGGELDIGRTRHDLLAQRGAAALLVLRTP